MALEGVAVRVRAGARVLRLCCCRGHHQGCSQNELLHSQSPMDLFVVKRNHDAKRKSIPIYLCILDMNHFWRAKPLNSLALPSGANPDFARHIG
jgi:hypothetical protein